jgi:site-specific recombinase XerD
MLLQSYLFHLKARKLSPRSVKAARQYLSQFLRFFDPLTSSKPDLEGFLTTRVVTCRPTAVLTLRRYLRDFFERLTTEGVTGSNPMSSILKPIVPSIEIKVLTGSEHEAQPNTV